MLDAARNQGDSRPAHLIADDYYRDHPRNPSTPACSCDQEREKLYRSGEKRMRYICDIHGVMDAVVR